MQAALTKMGKEKFDEEVWQDHILFFSDYQRANITLNKNLIDAQREAYEGNKATMFLSNKCTLKIKKRMKCCQIWLEIVLDSYEI